MMLLTPLLQLLRIAAVAVARKQDTHFWPKLIHIRLLIQENDELLPLSAIQNTLSV